MSSSKIKLKVQHNKHEKQSKQQKPKQIKQVKQKNKEQKSGAKLGKSKSKQKQDKKVIKQQSQAQQQTSNKKLGKDKSKDKKKDKKQEEKKDKKDKKQDKKQDKKEKQDKKDKKKKDGKEQKQEKKKDKKDKDKKDKDKKDKKKDKKGKNGKEKDSQYQQQDNSPGKKNKKSPRGKSKDNQLQTIGNINKQSDRAKMTIGQLIQLYKQASYDIFVNHGHNPQKQKQIEEQLQRLQKQKQKRRKKLQGLNKSSQLKKEEKEQQLQQRKKRKQQKLKQKRRQSASHHVESLTQQAKKRKQQHQKFMQYWSQRKNNFIPRYKKYEEQFKQFQNQLKQQQQQVMQQRKLKASPLDYDQLRAFQQQYQEQKLQALQHIERKQRLQKQIISQQNQWMKNLYKGKLHKSVLQQTNQNFIDKQLKTAKDKLQRTKQYGKLIKSQFIQQKDPQDQDDKTQNLDYNDQTILFHQKYKKGKCLGLIPQKKVQPLTHEQKQKLGVEYLEHIRKLPRKGINSSSLPKTIDVTDSAQKVGKTYILSRPKNPYYNVDRGGTSFDAKNHKQIQLRIQQIKSKDFSTLLQQRALNHVQYSDVKDLQQRHLNVNKRLIGDINHKLDVLKKLVD